MSPSNINIEIKDAEALACLTLDREKPHLRIELREMALLNELTTQKIPFGLEKADRFWRL